MGSRGDQGDPASQAVSVAAKCWVVYIEGSIGLDKWVAGQKHMKITFITLGIQLLNLTFSFVLNFFLPKGFLGELQSGAGRANWPCPGGKNAPCVILSKIILKEFIIQLKFWWKLSVQASQVLERLEEGKGEEGLKEDEVRLKPIIVHILLFSSVSSWLDISKIPNYAKM